MLECKACGAEIVYEHGMDSAECGKCGVRQSVPKYTDGQWVGALNSINALRRDGEFRGAAKVCDRMISEKADDPEIYWQRLLCRYGVEYVCNEDTLTYAPRVNTTQTTSVFNDSDFTSVIEFADEFQRKLYNDQASEVDDANSKNVLISQGCESFDIYLCCREFGSNGPILSDCVHETELFCALISSGYRVFFQKITLEDKKNAEREPYVFSALISAEVLIVVCTSRADFAVAGNELERYLSLAAGNPHKMIVFVSKIAMPSNLPNVLSSFHIIDMNKPNFMQELMKILPKETSLSDDDPKDSESVETLLEKVQIFLEEDKQKSAIEYCEHILDIEPQNADAYLYKLMAELGICHINELSQSELTFGDSESYRMLMRFANEKLKDELESAAAKIEERNELNRREAIYIAALANIEKGTPESIATAAGMFESICGYKDCEQMAKSCPKRAEKARFDTVRQRILDSAMSEYNRDTIDTYLSAREQFKGISGFGNADAMAAKCIEMVKKKRKELADAEVYNSAIKLMNKGTKVSLDAAMELLKTIPDYEASSDKLAEAKKASDAILRDNATALAASDDVNDLKKARDIYESIDDGGKHYEEIKLCNEKIAEFERVAQKMEFALEERRINRNTVLTAAIPATVALILFALVVVVIIIPKSKLADARDYYDRGDYISAYNIARDLSSGQDSLQEEIARFKYNLGDELESEECYEQAAIMFDGAGDYRDARNRSHELRERL